MPECNKSTEWVCQRGRRLEGGLEILHALKAWSPKCIHARGGFGKRPSRQWPVPQLELHGGPLI